MGIKIAVVVIYALLTVTLMILKGFKIGSRRRGVVKMITAALFVGIGIYGCVTRGGNNDVALAVGLGFAALGDLLLVFMNKHSCWVAGVCAFGGASVTLSVYASLEFGWQWWALIPFVLLVASSVVCQKLKVYSFGQDIIPLNVYTVCVSMCGSIGLVILCQAASAQAVLFGIGCFMYMLSDIFLGLYLLKLKYRAIDIVNTLLYFPGMLLIAVSLII